MYRVLLLFLSFSVLFVSCKKDDGNDVPQEQEVDAGFFALQVGNSWVYNYFRLDSNTGDLINVGATETVEITSEEEIGGETIFTMRTTTVDDDDTCVLCNNDPIVITKVKDSLGYLVEVDGPIVFSSINTRDYKIASFEYGDIYQVLNPNEVSISVPAGQFVVKDNERYAVKPDGTLFDGRSNLYYAEGIGAIRETYSGVTHLRILFERHLMSYTVQ